MESIVEGIVVRGDGRGRLLGFPTANVEPFRAAELPEDGVYAGWIELEDGSLHVAAISIGRRPTYYEDGALLLEAHLLDFDGDLYGEHVAVEVGARVRGQMRFSSGQELVTQIRSDVVAVRTASAGLTSSLGGRARAAGAPGAASYSRADGVHSAAAGLPTTGEA